MAIVSFNFCCFRSLLLSLWSSHSVKSKFQVKWVFGPCQQRLLLNSKRHISYINIHLHKIDPGLGLVLVPTCSMKQNNNILGSTITLTVEQNTSVNHTYIHKLRIYLIIPVVDSLKQQPSYSRNNDLFTNWWNVRCLTSSACIACLFFRGTLPSCGNADLSPLPAQTAVC